MSDKIKMKNYNDKWQICVLLADPDLSFRQKSCPSGFKKTKKTKEIVLSAIVKSNLLSVSGMSITAIFQLTSDLLCSMGIFQANPWGLSNTVSIHKANNLQISTCKVFLVVYNFSFVSKNTKHNRVHF